MRRCTVPYISVRLQSDKMGFSASMSEMLPTKGRPGGPGIVAVAEDIVCYGPVKKKRGLKGDYEYPLKIYVEFQNAVLVLCCIGGSWFRPRMKRQHR